MLTISYSNGISTTYTYNDARQWLMSVITRQGGTTVSSYTYARDALGRITSVTSPNAGESWTYSYDSLDRLVQATNPSNAALTQSFTYAINGNLLSATGVGTYSYPAASAARPHAVTAIGGQAITYSNNGNMISGRGRTSPLAMAQGRCGFGLITGSIRSLRADTLRGRARTARGRSRTRRRARRSISRIGHAKPVQARVWRIDKRPALSASQSQVSSLPQPSAGRGWGGRIPVIASHAASEDQASSSDSPAR